ncbi:DUF6657 family protein [Spirochaeta africana]|uniref:Uncharacterized protein n=1 Tax=Spirochaeta africana (strain ATCC 700263 / DSM 8902 / Z-7692) TaxID=889378 RepID=H9UFW6_SPIAZ|nr:DUF6657 family protein [Spirochaeta africana]AFG36409.1 hypothetical protein Spiaf_0301 [Spirochaeta africana DSM 8902]
MSRIKSALELALERTENVASDSQKLTAHERRQDGKRLLAWFYQTLMEGGLPAEDRPQGLLKKPADGIEAARLELQQRLKQYPEDEQQLVREGLTEVLLAGITLPQDETYRDTLERVRQAAYAISSNAAMIEQLFQQAFQILDQYLQERQQLLDNLRQQFEPRMRQKAEAYAQQTGQRVSLDPATDPEFQKYLQQANDQLQDYYGQAVQQIRDQLRQLI